MEISLDFASFVFARFDEISLDFASFVSWIRWVDNESMDTTNFTPEKEKWLAKMRKSKFLF